MKLFNEVFYNLNSPHFLAPMAAVTHLPFRLLCRSLGADVVVTELISVQSLYYNLIGEKKSIKLHHLIKTDMKEKPVGLQIFGHSKDHFSKLIKKLDINSLGYDFLDLNVGCPVNKVCLPGAGSRLLTDEKLPILESIIKEICNKRPDIPFSIKIRSGYRNQMNIRKFSEMVNQFELLMVTIHPRTAFQSYKEPANHTITSELVDLCNHPIIANGDISSLHDAKQILSFTNSKGVMIGRTARKHPWVFDSRFQKNIPVKDYINILKSYLDYCMEFGYPGVYFVREILSGMLRGFHNSSSYRNDLNSKESFSDLVNLINDLELFLEKYEITEIRGIKSKFINE